MGLGIWDYRLLIWDKGYGNRDMGSILDLFHTDSILTINWYQAWNVLIELIPDPFYIDLILISILDSSNGIKNKHLWISHYE